MAQAGADGLRSDTAYGRLESAIKSLEGRLEKAGLAGRLVIERNQEDRKRGGGPEMGWFIRQTDPGLVWEEGD
jgi:hypothetical protein